MIAGGDFPAISHGGINARAGGKYLQKPAKKRIKELSKTF
jgi:hypothetical protein